MANNPSDSEKLKLQIQIELDQESKRQAQEEINQLQKGTAGTGQKGTTSQTKAQTDAIKQQRAELRKLLADERFRIDQIDLSLRKARSAAQGEIEAIRQRAAASKTSIQQTNQLIAQQENIVENANTQAAAGYAQVAMSLDSLMAKYADVPGLQQDIINRQKQLFYATERMNSGFNSMSGSMSQLTGATTSANMAFVNFSRVVQDAPFGLIGLANNIDPLLVSFQQLSKESGGARQAFLALGRQLMGPAGLIFLLGSALPSALLFLQQRQRDTTKETDLLAEAINNVKAEFAALVSSAALEKGLPNLTEEFKRQSNALRGVENDINKINKSIEENAAKTREALLKAGVPGEAAQQAYKAEIELQKKANSDLAKLNKDKARVEGLYNKTREEFIKEREKQDNEELLNRYNLGVDYRNKQDDEEKKAKKNTISRIREVKEEDNRTYKSREEFLLGFYKFADEQDKIQLIEAKNTLLELINSQFATTEERLVAVRQFAKISTEIERDAVIKQIEEEDRLRKEAKEKTLNRIRSLSADVDAIFKQRSMQRSDAYEIEIIAAENANRIIEAAKLRHQQRIIDFDRENADLRISNYKLFLARRSQLETHNEAELTEIKLGIQTEYFDAIGALASASVDLFLGESKTGAIAQVVIDTIMGIQKIWSQSGINPVVGTIASTALAVKGMAAISKIRQTNRNTNSVSPSPGMTTREVVVQGVGENMGKILSVNGNEVAQNAQSQNIYSPSIYIDANVDRRGLAIAVREGEQQIRTQQFAYT